MKRKQIAKCDLFTKERYCNFICLGIRRIRPINEMCTKELCSVSIQTDRVISKMTSNRRLVKLVVFNSPSLWKQLCSQMKVYRLSSGNSTIFPVNKISRIPLKIL